MAVAQGHVVTSGCPVFVWKEDEEAPSGKGRAEQFSDCPGHASFRPGALSSDAHMVGGSPPHPGSPPSVPVVLLWACPTPLAWGSCSSNPSPSLKGGILASPLWENGARRHSGCCRSASVRPLSSMDGRRCAGVGAIYSELLLLPSGAGAWRQWLSLLYGAGQAHRAEQNSLLAVTCSVPPLCRSGPCLSGRRRVSLHGAFCNSLGLFSLLFSTSHFKEWGGGQR